MSEVREIAVLKEKIGVFLNVSRYSFNDQDSGRKIEGVSIHLGVENPNEDRIGYDIKKYSSKDLRFFDVIKPAFVGKQVVLSCEIDDTTKTIKLVPVDIRLVGEKK